MVFSWSVSAKARFRANRRKSHGERPGVLDLWLASPPWCSHHVRTCWSPPWCHPAITASLVGEPLLRTKTSLPAFKHPPLLKQMRKGNHHLYLFWQLSLVDFQCAQWSAGLRNTCSGTPMSRTMISVFCFQETLFLCQSFCRLHKQCSPAANDDQGLC